MNTGTKLRVSTALVATVALVSIAVAGATGTKAIKERHEAMEEIRDSMMVLGAMAKKETPFDANAVQANAKTIEHELTKAAKLFPEGSDQGDVETWAKAEIWSDRANFDKILQNGIEAAVAMQSVEDEAAFMPALRALGNSCKTCHDKYRRPRH